MIDTMPAAISLRQAAVRRERFSLGPLTVEIPRGLTTAIVGPNGSGKSTLFRLLLQLEPCAAGTAHVLGSEIRPGGDESYKRRVGFLAELPHAYENRLSVHEKARFAARWYPDWQEERFAKLLRRFDVDERGKLGKLSKGMRRKAEFAVALAHDPELLLLDEPSSGLDPFAWKTMLEELRRYMESGDRTIVIATHITEEVRRLADCILFLYRGRMLGFYEKDQLFDAWRELIVQGPADGQPPSLLPGLQGCEETGPGIYRLETDRPEEAQAYCSDHGFRILAAKRMELEDILNCLIRKEEARR